MFNGSNQAITQAFNNVTILFRYQNNKTALPIRKNFAFHSYLIKYYASQSIGFQYYNFSNFADTSSKPVILLAGILSIKTNFMKIIHNKPLLSI